ncbi:MAG: NosD domain-containing protein [Candidatus Methanoperedens sp.]
MTFNNIYRGRSLRKAFGILALILSLIGSAGAATWTVDDSGGADYMRIQDAIDNASAGDTILVYSGTYYENVNVSKKLTLLGIGKPVVDARGIGSAVTLSMDGTTLDGFNVRNGSLNTKLVAGIFVISNNNMIKNNNVLNNAYGIALWNSSYNKVEDNIANDNAKLREIVDGPPPSAGVIVFGSHNIIRNNNASNNFIGIGIFNGGPTGDMVSVNNTIEGNTVINNTGITGENQQPPSSGILLGRSNVNNNIIRNNSALNNRYGIIIFGSSNNTLTNNTAEGNDLIGIGIFSGGPTGNVVSVHNTVSSNMATLNHGHGFSLRNSINNNITGNVASNNDNYGISLESSSNNTLSGNNVSNNWFAGIYLEFSNDNMLRGNKALNNGGNGANLYYANNNILNDNIFADSITYYGINLFSSKNNLIYNNYFNNTNNAHDDGSNIWNITKTAGANIIGGSYLGGNYWSDYAGSDLNGDGLGDTLVPYNSSGNIANGGDFLPLTIATAGSITGYKINDFNGNGKWDAGEKGISNWTIRLIGITGNGKDTKIIRKETFTDAMGFYKYDNLAAGRYFIIEKLKKGFVPTSSPVKRIKLAQDENSMNNNFTNRQVRSQDRINGQRDMDDYEVINRDIDKYIEDME